MDFETEEQQVEALKKWWKENGMQVVVGAIIGIGAIVGWRYYGDVQLQKAQMASDVFNQVNVASAKTDQLTPLVSDLNNHYASTPYLEMGRLSIAKSLYQSGEADEAAKELRWIVENARQEEVKLVSRTRLARILIEQKKPDEAIALLDITYPESFTALFEELKGDAWVASGEKAKGRTAYDKALLFVSPSAKAFLQMKRDDLGSADIIPVT